MPMVQALICLFTQTLQVPRQVVDGEEEALEEAVEEAKEVKEVRELEEVEKIKEVLEPEEYKIKRWK